jgi:hypothetical protein
MVQKIKARAAIQLAPWYSSSTKLASPDDRVDVVCRSCVTSNGWQGRTAEALSGRL